MKKFLVKIFYITTFLVFCFSVKAYGVKTTVPALSGSVQEYVPQAIFDITVETTEIKLTKKSRIPYDRIPLEKELVDYIYQKTEEREIDFHVFIGLIDLETGETFNPNLISETNDHGLCQINKKYFEYHCKTAGVDYNNFNPYDPYDSVDVSLGVLEDLFIRYKDYYTGTDLVEYVLSSYNRGETGVKNYMDKYGTFSTPYSRIILEKAQKYKLEEFYEYQ